MASMGVTGCLDSLSCFLRRVTFRDRHAGSTLLVGIVLNVHRLGAFAPLVIVALAPWMSLFAFLTKFCGHFSLLSVGLSRLVLSRGYQSDAIHTANERFTTAKILAIVPGVLASMYPDCTRGIKLALGPSSPRKANASGPDQVHAATERHSPYLRWHSTDCSTGRNVFPAPPF